MPGKCPFYWYRSGVISYEDGCNQNKSLKLDRAMYDNYCNTDHYDRCPYFKPGASQSSSGCYLTSACVEAMQKSDDCFELTTLRRFRDEWLANQPGGKEEIEEYYRIAPEIVAKIHASDACAQIPIGTLRETGQTLRRLHCVRQKRRSARALSVNHQGTGNSFSVTMAEE